MNIAFNPSSSLRHSSRSGIISAALLLVSFIGAPAADAPAKDARQLLQEGLFEEEASHDLAKAADVYSALIAKVDAERALAATAIFRLAEVRSKQGKKDEALALWQRIVAEFPSQTALVKLSRERLSGLGVAPTAVAGAPETPSDEEAKELVRLRDIAKNSPDLLTAGNPDREQRTPLEYAAEHGWLKVADFLLAQGVKVDGSGGGYGPLVLAAEQGHKTMLDFLLDHGANINARSGHQSKGTALNAAIEKFRRAIINRLLERGARLDFPDDGRTPLWVACSHYDVEVAKILLDKGADPNVALKPEESPKGTAARVPPVGGNRPYHTSALLQAVKWAGDRDGRTDLLQLLLERGAKPISPDGDEISEVEEAIRQKNVRALNLLLLHAPKFKDGRILTIAVTTLDKEVLALTIKQMADINAPSSGTAPLLTAVNYFWLDGVTMLLEAGASPKVADASGLTALHYLAGWEFEPTDEPRTPFAGGTTIPNNPGYQRPPRRRLPQRPLRAAGVAISYRTFPSIGRNDIGKPESPVAIMNGEWARRRPIFEALLAKGADINARAKDGTTPFFCLLRENYWCTDAAEWFVAHGARIDDAYVTSKPDYKYSALLVAGDEMRPELARRFLLPKLGKPDTILVWGPGSEFDSDALKKPFEIKRDKDESAPPTLQKVVKPGSDGKTAIPGLNPGAPESHFAVINREGANGKWMEVAVVNLQTDPQPWPPLQWGDAVFLCQYDGGFTREK